MNRVLEQKEASSSFLLFLFQTSASPFVLPSTARKKKVNLS